MRSHTCLFFLFFFACSWAQSERRLALVKPSGSKEHFFKEGKRYAVDTGAEEGRVRGELHVVDDSTVSVGDIQIPVRNIRSVRTRNAGHRAIAVAAVAGGVPLATVGIFVIIVKATSKKKDPDARRGISKGGGVMSLIGGGLAYIGATELVRGRQYKSGTDAHFQVR